MQFNKTSWGAAMPVRAEVKVGFVLGSRSGSVGIRGKVLGVVLWVKVRVGWG